MTSPSLTLREQIEQAVRAAVTRSLAAELNPVLGQKLEYRQAERKAAREEATASILALISPPEGVGSLIENIRAYAADDPSPARASDLTKAADALQRAYAGGGEQAARFASGLDEQDLIHIRTEAGREVEGAASQKAPVYKGALRRLLVAYDYMAARSVPSGSEGVETHAERQLKVGLAARAIHGEAGCPSAKEWAQASRVVEALSRPVGGGIQGSYGASKATQPESCVPPSAAPSGPDMRKVVEALGFEPDNHHNAAKCPYCNPEGFVLVPREPTEAMLAVDCVEYTTPVGDALVTTDPALNAGIYRAMIAAAPPAGEGK